MLAFKKQPILKVLNIEKIKLLTKQKNKGYVSIEQIHVQQIAFFKTRYYFSIVNGYYCSSTPLYKKPPISKNADKK